LTLHLGRHDQQMLDGHFGPGRQMAMRIVVRLAETCGVTELMDVTGAHIDGCGLLSESSLLFAETLAGKAAGQKGPQSHLNNTARTFLTENAAAGQKGRPKPTACEISGLNIVY
jgi:predicted aconitase